MTAWRLTMVHGNPHEPTLLEANYVLDQLHVGTGFQGGPCRNAAVIGILLGGMAEDSVTDTYQISCGQWSSLLERPLALIVVALLAHSFFGDRLIGPVITKESSRLMETPDE